LKWAFTSTHASNWHPLTWISHMLDCSNLRAFSGWPSPDQYRPACGEYFAAVSRVEKIDEIALAGWMVAALFGWHPLHVESVAWVAERKDVLSTLFMLLTLGAYGRYVNEIRVQVQDSKLGILGAPLFCVGTDVQAHARHPAVPFAFAGLLAAAQNRAFSPGKAASGARESWRN